MANVSSSNSLGENVPKLRFPEFEGEWTCEKLSDFAEKVTRKNTNNKTELPLTISSKDGLVDQISYFNKTVASRDMSGYYLLKQGEYAYNKSYSVGFNFGSIKRLDRYPMGALSTLYICFALKKHNPDFIKTYFDSLKWYHEIHMIAAEGARNHGLLNVPTEDFFETKHWFPANMDEQKKIANFFGLLEYRIEIQQKLLEALKLYKRGLLEKLFPQKGESVPQYRFKEFTDDWQQRELNDIMNIVTDYVAAGSFEDIRKNVTYLSEVDYAQLVRTVDLKKKFSNNDFVYVDKNAFDYLWRVNLNEECIVLPNIGANIGEVYYIVPSELPYKNNVLGPNAILLKTEEDKYFVFTLLTTDSFQRSLFENVGSSGQPKFNKTELKIVKILLPSYEEQRMIGFCFHSFDRLITLHQKKQNTFIKIKNALLQQMFI